MNLVECLQEIPDFRRAQGRRYPLAEVLLLSVMSIICGYSGYREMTSFCKAHETKFLQWLQWKHQKLPSHVTFRTVLMGIDFNELRQAFKKWASQFVDIQSEEWLALDGKVLGSTVEEAHGSYQNFVSMVSVFSHQRKQVLEMNQYENKKQSEISVVTDLIEQLGFTGVRLTLDALHCQKKQPSLSMKAATIT